LGQKNTDNLLKKFESKLAYIFLLMDRFHADTIIQETKGAKAMLFGGSTETERFSRHRARIFPCKGCAQQ